MAIRELELVPIAELKPAPRNARTHSKRQIRQIAASIRKFGFTNPVLVDDGGMIVAGHGRVEAAKLVGMGEVPCLRLSHMTDADKRAYLIADNQLGIASGWDQEILADELQALMDLGFDVEATGFEMPEIDGLLAAAEEASATGTEPEDTAPEPGAPSAAVTRPGDLWLLGRHRLICADAKEESSIERLMAGRPADMLFTDPPYNCKIDGNVCGRGRTRHPEFAEASGELSRSEFVEFLRKSLLAAARVCRDGAIAYVCMDWRHMGEVQEAGESAFSELKNLCVWAKTNAGLGTFYRSQHELVFVWKVGDGPHINTFGLGEKGRHRSNLWTYPGVNGFKAGRMEELAAHPTSKNVALVADAIRDVTRGDLVLDVFGGSGTTLIAAEKTGRTAHIVEIEPAYCDVIIRRWEKFTGKQAVLDGSWARTFEEVAAERAADAAVVTTAEIIPEPEAAL